MKRLLYRTLLVLISLLTAMGASALDLPVKTVKGHKYYYYKVGRGETVYGISKKLGLSRNEIVEHNPSAADGVRKGMTLYFPFDLYSEPQIEEPAPAEEPVAAPEPAAETRAPRITLLLPLGADKSEPSKRNGLALDFYKGFLIGADSLSERPGAVEIYTVDTESPMLAGLDSILATGTVAVAPSDDSEMMERLAQAADTTGTFVFNIFNIADTAYRVYPSAVQGNVPQSVMYAHAVDAIMQQMPEATPVLLRSLSGRNEKSAFVDYLSSRYEEKGRTPIVIEYESALTMADFDKLSFSAGEQYVFIPSSGALPDFNKFAYAVLTLRERLAAAAMQTPELPAAKVTLFGYPDWTAFRGDALETLHRLDARVYSRFYDNFEGFDARTFAETFRRIYGGEIIDSVPSQALLGFDTACFLIRSIRSGDGVFSPDSPARYTGIQSSFEFEKTDAGWYNAALYIINYRPDGTMTSILQ